MEKEISSVYPILKNKTFFGEHLRMKYSKQLRAFKHSPSAPKLGVFQIKGILWWARGVSTEYWLLGQGADIPNYQTYRVVANAV